MSKSVIALCCIEMGIVLAACGAGGAAGASIASAGQDMMSSMPRTEQATAIPIPITLSTLTSTPRLDTMPAPTATSTPAWAVFPPMPATPYKVDALYQTFEHGFMVWRGDANCVYALSPFGVGAFDAIIPAMISTYSYCLTVDPLTTEDETGVPPEGLFLPTGVLGKVWKFYPEVRAKLGYALQPENNYLSTIPAVDDLLVLDGMVSAIPQMTLPDGHILACGARGATAGTCRWFNTK